MTKLVFCDTETTGLDRERHEPWEIALIVRTGGDPDTDTEYCWRVLPDLSKADPTALRFNRFYERAGTLALGEPSRTAFADVHPSYGNEDVHQRTVASDIARLVFGATIVGAVPDFDAGMLRRWLAKHDQCWAAHYHLVDVETFAAGALGIAPPWGFDNLLAAYSLAYDESDRHTALGDTRMVRDLYDQVLRSKGSDG